MHVADEHARPLTANIRKLYLYFLLTDFQLGFAIFVVYLQQMRGLSLTAVTLMETAFMLTIALAQAPAGAFADRFGRKPALALSSAIMAIASLAFGLAATLPLLILSNIVWGFAFAMRFGADGALVFDSLKAMGRSEDFQKAYGRVWAFSAASILSGGLIGAPLAQATALNIPFLVSAVISGFGLVVALTFREPPRGEEERPSYLALIRESVALAARLPTIRYSLLFYGVVGVSSFSVVIFLQPFLVGHGVSVGQIGLFATSKQIAIMMGSSLAYRMSPLLGERRSLYAMAGGPVLAYAVLGTVDHLAAYGAFLLVNFLFAFGQPVIGEYLNQRVGSRQRATVLSLRQLVATLLTAVYQPLLGRIADAASLQTAFLVHAGVSGVALSAILVLWLNAQRHEQQAVFAPVMTAE